MSILKGCKRSNKKNVINLVILLVYLAIQITISLHHEAWRDESQAWILARNTSFIEIFSLCASEGHPCLWFLLLKLCVKLGVSFYHFSYISIIIMTAAAAVLLWKSPFHIFTKICILLSPIYYYYNSVICRVYAVAVLLVVLLCCLWEERFSKPLAYSLVIACLFQSHILFAGLALGCMIEMIINDKKRFEKNHLLGLGLQLSSFLCLIFELRQTDDTETYLHIKTEKLFERLENKTIDELTLSITEKFTYNSIPTGKIILWLTFLIIIIFAVRYFLSREFRIVTKGTAIVFLCGMMFYWGIILLIRSAEHIQMAIVFWIILLFFVWTASIKNKPVLPDIFDRSVSGDDPEDSEKYPAKIQFFRNGNSFEIIFCVCCLFVLYKSAWLDPMSDLKGPFSGSLDIVKQTEKLLPEKAVIVIKNNEYSTSIAAYLYESGKNFMIWDIDNGSEFRIHKWGRKNGRSVAKERVYDFISDDFSQFESVYYIESAKSLNAFSQQNEKMVLIGQNTEPNIWNEYYRLYRAEK